MLKKEGNATGQVAEEIATMAEKGCPRQQQQQVMNEGKMQEDVVSTTRGAVYNGLIVTTAVVGSHLWSIWPTFGDMVVGVNFSIREEVPPLFGGFDTL